MNRNIKYILTFTVFSVFVSLYANEPKKNSLWKIDFTNQTDDGTYKLPEGWEIKKKIGINTTKFSVDKTKDDTYLCVRSDNSSGTLICKLQKVDLTKTPILSWRWRANKLPKDGDGRENTKDDQACGIYIGAGNIFRKKSISYRWDTETPEGTEGSISYAMGSIKVKWFTLKNKECVLGKWYVEERNIAEDFKQTWGYIPTVMCLSICGNSQYSKTEGSVDIDWIEFKSQALKKENLHVKRD